MHIHQWWGTIRSFLEFPIAAPKNDTDADFQTSPITDSLPKLLSTDDTLSDALPDDYFPPITDLHPSSTTVPLRQSTRPRIKPDWLNDFVSSVVHLDSTRNSHCPFKRSNYDE